MGKFSSNFLILKIYSDDRDLYLWWKTKVKRKTSFQTIIALWQCTGHSRFERIHSHFESNSIAGKMLSNSMACYLEIIHERKSVDVANFIVIFFKKLSWPTNLQQLLYWSAISYEHWCNTLHQQNNYDSLKAQIMVSIF